MMNGIKSQWCAQIIMLWCLALPLTSWAQPSPSERADEVLAESAPASAASGASAEASSLPWLELMLRGGWLMVPITLMSVIVVAIAVERSVALRRSRLLPGPLTAALNQMAAQGTFDPSAAEELCERYPSGLARVMSAMLTKLGRAANEIEHAVSDTCQREADSMYSHVRTLNLASTVTPLLGLLGTVQGMIQAFFITANLAIGSNKSEALAEGIYVALVTTFAGLSVAIPASVLAHLFESRILRLLRDIEQIAASLLPYVEGWDDELQGNSQKTNRGANFSAPRKIPKSKAS